MGPLKGAVRGPVKPVCRVSSVASGGSRNRREPSLTPEPSARLIFAGRWTTATANDGERLAADDYGFGPLHICRNGLVFVNEVDRRADGEVVSGENE